MHLSCTTQTESRLQNFVKKAYWLFFVFAFWGPALGGISLGPVSLFPARIFALVTWTLLLLAAVLDRPRFSLERTLAASHWYDIFFLIWLVWSVFSLSWTADLIGGIRDLFNLFIGLSLVGMAPLVINDKTQLNRAAKIWLFTFAIFLVLATIEHLTTLHLPISRFSQGFQPHLAFRPTGVFVNENNFAVFINLSIPFLLARLRCFPQLWSRIFAGLGLACGVYMLFVTGSRINWIAFVVLILVYSLLLTQRGNKLKILVVLTLLIFGAYFVLGAVQPALRRIMEVQLDSLLTSYLEIAGFTEVAAGTLEGADPSEGTGNAGGGTVQVGKQYLVSNNSIAIRLNLVRNGILFLTKSRGVGTGVGSFEAWIERDAVYDTKEIVNPHNWWIELLAEYGIIVTVGYLALYASLFWAAWKGWKRSAGEDKWIPEALTLTLAILPLVSISPSSFLDYMPHWLLVALALAWLYNGKRAEDAA